jgi:hypothetical protein
MAKPTTIKAAKSSLRHQNLAESRVSFEIGWIHRLISSFFNAFFSS